MSHREEKEIPFKAHNSQLLRYYERIEKTKISEEAETQKEENIEKTNETVEDKLTEQIGKPEITGQKQRRKRRTRKEIYGNVEKRISPRNK